MEPSFFAALGRMHPAGLAAFERRDDARSRVYSFERRDASLTSDGEAAFRANVAAWDFLQAQPPSYRKAAIWWVIRAKKEETRRKRLAALIAESAQRRRIAARTSPSRRTVQRPERGYVMGWVWVDDAAVSDDAYVREHMRIVLGRPNFAPTVRVISWWTTSAA